MKTSVAISLLILMLPFIAAASDVPARVTPGQVATEVVHAAVRAGDASAGRDAFVDLKCSRCHRVQGDEKIRRDDCIPVGPELKYTGASEQEVAAAIVARTPVGDRWVAADESGMSGSTARMTMKQVADIVEYLRAEK